MIYLVEDDESIRELVIYTLKSQGMEAKGFERPSLFWKELEKEVPALILLDVMLPEEDGISILKKLRSRPDTRKLPVIMLTAKTEDGDKITGLTLGADDYIAKPFNPLELVARVKAQLRRSKEFNHSETKNVLEYLDLSMNLETHRVFLNAKEVFLTPKEFAILELLWKNKGNVFSTEHIYNTLWSEEEAYDTNNVVMVHIRNLRSKIESDVKNPRYIKTVWGVGYKFS